MKNRLKKLVPDFSHSDGAKVESVSLVSSGGYASSQLRGSGLYSLLEAALNKTGAQSNLTYASSAGTYAASASPVPAPLGNPLARFNYDSIVFENGDLNFHEMHLQDGSQYSPWQDSALLTRTVQMPTYVDGNGVTQTCTVDTTSAGWSKSGGNTWTMNHEFGYWTYDTAANKLTYTFDSKAEHLKNSPEDDALSRDYDGQIVFVGENGAKYEDVKFEITVHDDIPEVLPGSVQIQTSESVNSFLEIAGGADGVAKLVISVNGREYDVTGATAQNKADIAGEFGQMQVWQDDAGYWRYSYTAKSGSEISQSVAEKVTFIVTDGDGDVVTAKDALEIKIDKADVPVLELEVGSVDEAGLPAHGSDPSGASHQTGWVAIDPDLLPMGAQVAGTVYSSQYGEVEVRINALEQYEFRYTLNNALKHPDGLGRNVDKDSVTITYKDPVTGAHGEIHIKVNVTDDLPSIDFGAGSSNGQGHVQSGDEFTGSYKLAYGADRAADSDALKLTVVDPVTGQSATITANAGGAIVVKVGGVEYGTLYLDEGSTFRFKANDGVSGKLELHLSVTDKDGDTVSSDVPFVLEISEPIGKIVQVDKNFYFDEAHLPEGNAEIKKPGELFGELEIPKTSSGEYYTIDTSTGGWTLMNSDPSYQHWELNVASGKLIYMFDVDGNVPPMLTYQLTQATMHARPGVNPGEPGDYEINVNVGKVTLEGPGGNKVIVDVEVQVRDDNPYMLITKGGDDTLDGNGTDYYFVSTGEFEPHFGADGPDHSGGSDYIRIGVSSNGPAINGGRDGRATWVDLDADGTPQTVQTTHGWMELSWNPQTGKISYVYTAIKGNAGDDHTFRINALDGDLDRGTSAEFAVTLGSDVPEMVLKVNESGLQGGTDPGAAISDSGTISLDHWTRDAHEVRWNLGNNPALQADCNGDGVFSKVTWQQVGNSLVGMAEGKVVLEVVPVFKNGVFTGEMTTNLYSSVQHLQPGFDLSKDLIFKFGLVNYYVDQNGQDKEFVRTSNVAVRINDDAPENVDFGGDSASIQAGSVYEGYWNADFGADGPAASGALSVAVTVNGVTQVVNLTVGQSSAVVIGGVRYGELLLSNDAYSADPSKGNSFKFYPNNSSGKIEFDFVATDKDLDSVHSSGGKFTLNITNPIGKIEQVDKNFYFEESHLPEGNAANKNPNLLYGELEIPKTGSGEYYTIDTSTGGWTLMNSDPSYQHWELSVASGKLIYMFDVDGNVPPMLMYNLNKATMHEIPTTTSLNDVEITLSVGKVTLQSPGGNDKFEVDVEVQVRDDDPYAVVSKGGDDYLDGNGTDYSFVSSGEFTPHFGADGARYDAKGGIMVAVGDGGPVLGGGAMGHWTWLHLPSDGTAQKVYTTHGWMTLSWDPATQKVTYTYSGVRGNAGEVLDFRFYVYDADGDTGKPAEFKITLGADVPDVVLNVSESGLAVGSSPNAADTTDSGFMSADHLRLSGTSITWNMSSMPNVNADSNHDGIYSRVTWAQSGNQLIGSAEGKVVATITPVFKNGVFTGEMSVTLHNPIQHDKGANDEFMDLGFKYAINGTYVDENGVSKPTSQGGNLVVRVEDDEPVFSGAGGAINPNSGNLITNVNGADAVTGVVSVWVNGIEYAVSRQSNGTMSTNVININGAKMIVYGDGTYTVDKQGASGSVNATIRVTVSDADGDLTTGPDYSLSIAHSNKAPTAANDYASVNEDALGASGNVLYNDIDPDGNALSVTNIGTFATTYGFITINADGSYNYSVNTSNASVKALYNGTHSDPNYKLSDSFTYKISDGHGGNSSAQIKFDLTPNQLKTPSGNTTTGGAGDDIMLGDLGGVTQGTGNVAGKAHNVAIMVENSALLGNMGNLVHVKNALNSMVKQLQDEGGKGSSLNVCLISVNSGAKVEVSIKGLDTAAELNQLYNAINSLTPQSSGTFFNLGVGFMRAQAWFKEQPTYVTNEFGGVGAGTKYENSVYFIGQGIVEGRLPPSYSPGGATYPSLLPQTWEPGTFMSRIVGSKGSAIREDGTFMNSSDGGRTWNATNVNIYGGASHGMVLYTGGREFANDIYYKYFDSKGVKVNVLEYPLGYTIPNVLNNYDNTNGVTKLPASGAGAGLDSVIKSEMGSILTGGVSTPSGPTAAQNTTMKGNGGFNTMFGDALNADWLLSDRSWNQSGLKAGQSYDIVRAYVMQKYGLSASSALLNDAMREFIEANSFKFGASESGRGGNDTMYGGNGGNIMFGQGGNDIITGGNGSDLIFSGSGMNKLAGGQGVDVFVFKGGESTGANNITDFNSAQGDIIVKVGSGAFGSINGSYTAGDVHNVVDVRQGHSVSITDSQNHMLVGSGYSDTKIVSGGVKYDNILNGGGGNDVIFGGRGDNLLNGGAGNDYIIGGNGNDRIYGGSGNDILYGGAGNDILYGGSGTNKIYGDSGQDTFTWQSRSDLQGKDILMDFSTSEDHLSFNPLLNAGQTLANFFSSNVNGMSFNNAAHTFSFNVTNGSSSKAVEVHFGNNDAGYNEAYSDFLSAGNDQAAQQAAMLNFLNSISGGI